MLCSVADAYCWNERNRKKMNQKGLNDFFFVNFLHQKLLLVTAEQLQEDQLWQIYSAVLY